MKEKIKDWLLKGGLPFEMEVSNMFLDAGFLVAQSVYYKDNDSNKYRETDIIAHHFKKINGVYVNLTFIVECKSSIDKPWVVLQNERLTNSINPESKIYHTQNFTKAFEKIISESKFDSDLIYKNKRQFGYSLITALNNNGGNDKAYESTQTLLKSCEHLVYSTNNSGRKVCNLYFPLIIIKGDLYSAKMISDNDLKIEEITEAEIIISRSYHEFNNSSIRIFNNKNLFTNIESLKKHCDDFFDNYNIILEKNIE